MKEVLQSIHDVTLDGGAIYFMQREKNAEDVLRVLRESAWLYQNLIIWKKKTSAVPCDFRFSKQYQIIAYATKGAKPRVFHKLRIDPPKAPGHKFDRPNGVFISDIWDDIRELTSGYFAGDEALREDNGGRAHVQQSPIALLLRIILSSTKPGDLVLDPFAGSGTTNVVAAQLKRPSISIEIDPQNVNLIVKRLREFRLADSINDLRTYYRFTRGLEYMWETSEELPKAAVHERIH
jgi:DNA modification methylase